MFACLVGSGKRIAGLQSLVNLWGKVDRTLGSKAAAARSDLTDPIRLLPTRWRTTLYELDLHNEMPR